MGDEADRINDVSPDTTISIDFDPPKRRRRAPGEAAGTRKENDAYDTPPELALACAEWVKDYVIWDVKYMLDPTAGTGAFVRAARQTFPNSNVAAVDIQEGCRAACLSSGSSFHCADALRIPPKSIARTDLILTNPPFKLAGELVAHFYANMHDGAVLAFLLNITFLGAEGRWDPGGLYDLAPLTYCIPIVPRPSFLTIDGKATSPKFEAALFVWDKPDGDEDRWDQARGAVIPTQPIRWKKSR